MTTVMDHASPWLMPSSTLAATIHAQLGATPISSGTGSAAAQPAISSRRRPARWARAPAPRFVNAFARPKATMNDRTAALEPRWKSSTADERQRRAFQADHHADERVDRDEQRELRGVLAQPEADRRRGHANLSARAAAAVGGDDRGLLLGRRRDVGRQRRHEGILGVERQRAVVAALEPDRRDRVGRQAATADRPGVVRRVQHEVIGERQQALGE